MLFFALRGVSLIHKDDSFNQFFPAFAYVGEYIRELIETGRAIQFDFCLRLGDDVVGVLNYYGFGDIIFFFIGFLSSTRAGQTVSFTSSVYLFFSRIFNIILTVLQICLCRVCLLLCIQFR